MNTLTVPIAEGRSDLCKLLKKVEAGTQIILTDHGKPKAVITAYKRPGPPARAERPADPKLFGDLQSPVMEDWQ